MKLLGQCRCCRKPIKRAEIACWRHWRMLPKPLKDAILYAARTDHHEAHARYVAQADVIWRIVRTFETYDAPLPRDFLGTRARSAVYRLVYDHDGDYEAAFASENPRQLACKIAAAGRQKFKALYNVGKDAMEELDRFVKSHGARWE